MCEKTAVLRTIAKFWQVAFGCIKFALHLDSTFCTYENGFVYVAVRMHIEKIFNPLNTWRTRSGSRGPFLAPLKVYEPWDEILSTFWPNQGLGAIQAWYVNAKDAYKFSELKNLQ